MGLLVGLLVGLGLSADESSTPGGAFDRLAPLPLWRGARLLHGAVRGQRWVHNPHTVDGLALLSPLAATLLDAADGRTLAAIAAALGGDARLQGRLADELPRLLALGLLRTDGGELRAALETAPKALAARLRPRPSPPAIRTFDLWLHLTNACNLACPYCYIRKSPEPMTEGPMARVLASLERAAGSGAVDAIHVRYAGGEPLLHLPALQRFHADAQERCARYGVRYSAAILTNGTAVPAAAPAWVAAEGVGVSVSIDGLGAVQDAMRPTRGGRGSWALLERGLAAWRAAGIRPYALVTLGHTNVASAPELVAWLLEQRLGFRLALVRDLEWGRGDGDDRRGAARAQPATAAPAGEVLQDEELARILRPLLRAYDVIEEHVSAAVDAGRRVDPPFRATHRFCDLSPFRPIAKACGAGSNYAAIGHAGTVSPCQAALHHEAEVRAIDPTTSLWDQARSHQPFGTFERRHGNATCEGCRHRASCAGGCPLLLQRRDGHIDGRSPYCEVFRAVLPRIVGIAALELWGRGRRAEAPPTGAREMG